jgi:hypothetical protein
MPNPKRTRKYEPEEVTGAEQTPYDKMRTEYRPGILDKPDPPARVLVALPTRDHVPAEFMHDFARLTATVCSTMVADGLIEWSINMLQGTAIHTLRQELAELALERDATHMLWLDTDHRFPANAFFRLWAHHLPMVGVNYSTRKWPCTCVAFKRVATTPAESNVKVYTLPESSGVEKVDAVGFGMVLLDVAVLRSLDPKERWFMWGYDPESKRDMGEDVYFCSKVRQAGWDIHIDHDLSKEVGHLGTFEYRVDHANMWLGEDLANGDKQLLKPADSDLVVAREK